MPNDNPLSLRVRVRLFVGFVAWCACMIIPQGRIWWRLLPYAGFYAYFDRSLGEDI